ncbi:MAG: AAA family ATPase [Bacteroidia bacterium]
MEPQALSERIGTLLKSLNRDLFEKEKVMSLTLLSAISGESIFLLGPPGVAKSMIARRLKYAFKNARSFEYLMGKFSTPDEVFGPVSISKLKDEDKYERLTDKYLPGANIVFLDEIWKASPPIQNSLLTVLNEKIYRNGEQEFKVDLRGLIAASNELPLRGEGLEALWDRFLVRQEVAPIQSDELFNRMLNLPKQMGYQDPVEDALKITDTEYETWEKEIDNIEIPTHVMNLFNHLRRTIRERNLTSEPNNKMFISDRRWRKMAHLLTTSAFLNGRKEVDLMDCFLIGECIWDTFEHIEEAHAIVMGAIAAYGYRQVIQLKPLQSELESLSEEIKAETQVVKTVDNEVAEEFTDQSGVAFYQLLHFFGKDSVAYIRSSDWIKFETEGVTYIPIFEAAGGNFRPFQNYQIQRKDNFTAQEKGRDLPLKTIMEPKEVVSPKVANPATLKIWNNQTDLLLEECEKYMVVIDERRLKDEPYLRNNLFVDPQMADHVMDSLETTTRELLNLKLEIQKTRHSYEPIEES